MYGVNGASCDCATAAAAKTSTTMTTSTSTIASVMDACRHCTPTQRCVVRSRGAGSRVRCVTRRRRPDRWSSSRRRAPDGQCPPGWLPSRHRRRCTGTFQRNAMTSSVRQGKCPSDCAISFNYHFCFKRPHTVLLSAC